MLKISILATALLGASLASTTAAAAGNPMDSVGVAHNLYLECLSLSKDPGVSPLRRIVEECGFDPGMSTDEFVEKYQAFIELDPGIPLLKKMTEYKSSYSEYQFTFFIRMDEIFAVAKNQADADARFAKLESEAVAKLGTNDPGDRSVLSALSTARHSLRYWSAQDATTGSMTAARWPKWVRVLTIVAADAAGVALAGLGGGAGASSMAGAILNELDPKVP
jgi:hypothetical protein